MHTDQADTHILIRFLWPFRPGLTVYDRYVRWMRIVLTAVAIALALLIVLWPVLKGEEVSFVLSYDDIVSGDDQIRMVNPNYVGIDSRGRRYTVSAQTGIQPSIDDALIRLQSIDAEIELLNGFVITAESRVGVFYIEQNLLELSGDVVLQSNDGYVLRAGDTHFDINSGVARSHSPIQGTGPVGRFIAGGYEVKVNERVVVFSNKVRMTIDPLGRKSN